MEPAPVMVAVALKNISQDTRIDALTGEVERDEPSSALSRADQAALEWALRLAGIWSGGLAALTAGRRPSERVLRTALAAGASRALRVDLAPERPSEAVARALAAGIERLGAQVVICGDMSPDRGSGAVPAYLAAHLSAAQGLGLLDIKPDSSGRAKLQAWRRLDGGRRELLTLHPPCVLSVEGSSAVLRRSSLPAVLATSSGALPIEVMTPAEPTPGPAELMAVGAKTMPFRPRTHLIAPPDPSLDPLQRVIALTGATSDHAPAKTVVADPQVGADSLLDALRSWGELQE